MFNFTHDREKPSHTFNGMYRGVVEDNKDPDDAGRVKIRVFSVYGDIDVSVIPWAEYADPFMFGGKSSGGLFVPDTGDKVWCFFENGSPTQPVYFAGSPCKVDFPDTGAPSMPDKRGEPSYPDNRVFQTKKGHMVEIDDTDGNTRIRIMHKSGTQYVMYDNGDLYEYIVGNHKRFILGNVEEHISGNTKKLVNGSITEHNGGTRNVVVGGDHNIDVGGINVIQSSGDSNYMGANINLNSESPSPTSPTSPDIPELSD